MAQNPDGTEKGFRIYVCRACGAAFFTRDDLRHHIYEEHVEDDDKVDADVEHAAAEAGDEPELEAYDGPGEHEAPGDDEGKTAFTHKVLRNREGRCAVVQSSQPVPPGWTRVFGPNTEVKCRAWMHHDCGAFNRC